MLSHAGDRSASVQSARGARISATTLMSAMARHRRHRGLRPQGYLLAIDAVAASSQGQGQKHEQQERPRPTTRRQDSRHRRRRGARIGGAAERNRPDRNRDRAEWRAHPRVARRGRRRRRGARPPPRRAARRAAAPRRQRPASGRRAPRRWSAPSIVAAEPGEPPFVKVGRQVKEGHTLFIVEAMKTMNPIPAPRGGKVHGNLRRRRPAGRIRPDRC